MLRTRPYGAAPKRHRAGCEASPFAPNHYNTKLDNAFLPLVSSLCDRKCLQTGDAFGVPALARHRHAEHDFEAVASVSVIAITAKIVLLIFSPTIFDYLF